MRLRLAFAASLLALTLLPAAQADPLPEPAVCYSDPCVEEEATVGSAGVDASVRVFALGGFRVGAHVGPDAVLLFYGAGITSCVTGVDLDPLDLVFFCAV